MTTDMITTHFDYHSIDHNLLKLDILGHDDPTMIRMLQDLTGLDPVKDYSAGLYQERHVLVPEYRGTGHHAGGYRRLSAGCPWSPGVRHRLCVIQMRVDAKPQSFSDLVRIAGLAHGTDVWLGNAQDA